MEGSRRNSVRIPQLRKARLLAGRLALRCTIVDLSVGGALIDVDRAPPMSSGLYLEIAVAAGSPPLLVEGAVVRRTFGGRVALQFVDGDRDGVGRFLAMEQRALLAKGRRPSYERRRRR